jgi:phage-related protein
MTSGPKTLQWWADAYDVLTSFPEEVQDDVGYALHIAQTGGTAGSAKPAPYAGKGVYAIATDHDRETYRTFYVARFEEAVYCFYVVHKKATKGIDLPERQKKQAARRYREITEWREAMGLP